ncbi:hypothetical protein GGR57DRAFT_236825 [Xylariaceae sp. FL1272]|nr:hypothetical protein GGR57DRAFT_236825 [Xylariaceae sp. FL1272]
MAEHTDHSEIDVSRADQENYNGIYASLDDQHKYQFEGAWFTPQPVGRQRTTMMHNAYGIDERIFDPILSQHDTAPSKQSEQYWKAVLRKISPRPYMQPSLVLSYLAEVRPKASPSYAKIWKMGNKWLDDAMEQLKRLTASGGVDSIQLIMPPLDPELLEALRINGSAKKGLGTMPDVITIKLKQVQAAWMLKDPAERTVPDMWKSYFEGYKNSVKVRERRLSKSLQGSSNLLTRASNERSISHVMGDDGPDKVAVNDPSKTTGVLKKHKALQAPMIPKQDPVPGDSRQLAVFQTPGQSPVSMASKQLPMPKTTKLSEAQNQMIELLWERLQNKCKSDMSTEAEKVVSAGLQGGLIDTKIRGTILSAFTSLGMRGPQEQEQTVRRILVESLKSHHSSTGGLSVLGELLSSDDVFKALQDILENQSQKTDSELANLRHENSRLRQEVANLQQETSTLRQEDSILRKAIQSCEQRIEKLEQSRSSKDHKPNSEDNKVTVQQKMSKFIDSKRNENKREAADSTASNPPKKVKTTSEVESRGKEVDKKVVKCEAEEE